jgi:hypothetical protein
LQNDPYIMLTGNGQIHNVLGQGYPLKIVVPSEGALATPAVFDIIKGSKQDRVDDDVADDQEALEHTPSPLVAIESSIEGLHRRWKSSVNPRAARARQRTAPR